MIPCAREGRRNGQKLPNGGRFIRERTFNHYCNHKGMGQNSALFCSICTSLGSYISSAIYRCISVILDIAIESCYCNQCMMSVQPFCLTLPLTPFLLLLNISVSPSRSLPPPPTPPPPQPSIYVYDTGHNNSCSHLPGICPHHLCESFQF